MEVAIQINNATVTLSYKSMRGKMKMPEMWEKNEPWCEWNISHGIYDRDTFQTYCDFLQHFLQPLKDRQSFLWGEFNSMSEKKG